MTFNVNEYTLVIFGLHAKTPLSRNCFFNTKLIFTDLKYHELQYKTPLDDSTINEIIAVIKGLLPDTPDFFDDFGFDYRDDLVYTSMTIDDKTITYIDDDVTESIIKQTLLKSKENIKIILYIHENAISFANDFLRFFILTKNRDNHIFFQKAMEEHILMCL